ncbi:hypothetical protein B6U71_03665 [Euryarchaeota archaeon ex4484_178]|nr:hypothetical protein [Thermoplasmata archaeon]OYT58852.1 MAG: hypothetical protein B6U71_03665 [Euryarchaeota archaeon ex4484_178]
MNLEELADTVEEYLMDLLARVDDGDEEALEELKKAKIYFEDLVDAFSLLKDDDTIDSIKEKFDELSKKFDKFLMDIVKVVG